MVHLRKLEVSRLFIGDSRRAKFVATAKKLHRLHILLSKTLVDFVQSESLSFIHRLYNLVLLRFMAGRSNVVSTKTFGQSATRPARFLSVCVFFHSVCLSSFPGALKFRVIVYKLEV